MGRTNGGAEGRAADAIRDLIDARLEDGRLLRHAVLVAQTEASDGSDARTETFYPLGTLDVATERGMLERSLDRLKRHGR